MHPVRVLAPIVAANEVLRTKQKQPLNALEETFCEMGRSVIGKENSSRQGSGVPPPKESEWNTLAAVATEVADQSVPFVTPRWFRDEARAARDLDESATLEQCATLLELLHDRYALYGYDTGASWELQSEYLDWLTLLHGTRGDKKREAVTRRAAAKARKCMELKLDAVDAHMRGDDARHSKLIADMHRTADVLDGMLGRSSFKNHVGV